MLLKKANKPQVVALKSTTPAPAGKTKADTKGKKTEKKDLGSDEYKVLFEQDVVIDEKRFIKVSVKRGGKLGIVSLDIRQYQTTEVYTGHTSKGINIPIQFSLELLDSLKEIIDEAEDLFPEEDETTEEDTDE